MLTQLWSRRLSRKGQHAAALMLSSYDDSEVLCRAGMFLTLLQKTKESSIFAGIAHAQTGNIDQALAIAATHIYKEKRVRNLLGLIAAAGSSQICDLLQGRPSLRPLYQFMQVNAGDFKDKIVTDKYLSGLSPLLAYDISLQTGDSIKAHRYFERQFTRFDLIPPSLEEGHNGINLKALKQPIGNDAMDGPLVSIVLTAHNEQDCLEMAVRSIREQSWRNLEIVIVDDASTDDTRRIANKLAAEDSRIRLVTLPVNLGLWKAKNIGFQYATADYIAMHDADDWSHRQKIEKQVRRLIRNRSLMATSSDFFRVDESTGRPFTRNACSYVRWNPSSFMFRREVLCEVGNFIDKLLGSDCEFVARVESRYGAAAHERIRLPLSVGYQRSGSLSNCFRNAGDCSRHIRLAQWEHWRRLHVFHYIQRRVMKFEDETLESLSLMNKGVNQITSQEIFNG